MLNSRIISSFRKGISTTAKNFRYSSFKSELSLDKLYPHSTEIKPFKPPESVDGKFTGYIPLKDVIIKYSAASAPGGQHVNKTETKVDIRFHVQTAKWLKEDTKQKLLEKYCTKINKEGYFVVKSEKTRSRILNTADALAYIRELIFKLETPPKEPTPESIEKRRKNLEKANRIRLMEKRRKSCLLRMRSEFAEG